MRRCLSGLVASVLLVSAAGQAEEQKPAATGAPVKTPPPNVPEFKPAFPGQTRAPEVRTRTPFVVTELASGFREPWAIAFLPDRRMLVTEKPTGHLFIVAPDGKKSPPVEGLPPVDGRDQGGLLDVEVGPDYPKSHLIYWTYYEPREGGNGLAVARARLIDAEKPRVEGVQVIFRMQPTLDSTKHAGGRLVFAPDGTLFVTLGERSILPGRVQARDLKSDLGKIVRIFPDGSIPKDNPFVGTKGARPEIWTRGHRNVLVGGARWTKPAVDRRDGPARWRRAEPDRARQGLRLADDRLRRGVLGQADPQDHPGAGARAARLLLGPGDLAERADHLLGRAVPRVEGKLLHRWPLESGAGAAGARRTIASSARSACSPTARSASARWSRGRTARSISSPTRRTGSCSG